MNKLYPKYRTSIIISSVIIFLLLATPLVVFCFKFFSAEISDQMSDWGAFGDLFNSSLNAFISLVSLIILVYITVLIGNNSTQENKNLFFLQKRVEAFELLFEHQENAEIVNLEAIQFVFTIQKTKDRDISVERALKVFQVATIKLRGYELFIKSFSTRYGNTFQYDFNSLEYKNLHLSATCLADAYKDISDSILELNKDKGDNVFVLIENNKLAFSEFCNKLRIETEQ